MNNSEYTSRLEAQSTKLDALGTKISALREEYLSAHDNDEATIIDMLNRSMGSGSTNDPEALSAEDEAAVTDMLLRSGPKGGKRK
ncbi:MAG: hypothetical protein ACLQVJ_12340 [Syntrophobacteraceae bacterium]